MRIKYLYVYIYIRLYYLLFNTQRLPTFNKHHFNIYLHQQSHQPHCSRTVNYVPLIVIVRHTKQSHQPHCLRTVNNVPLIVIVRQFRCNGYSQNWSWISVLSLVACFTINTSYCTAKGKCCKSPLCKQHGGSHTWGPINGRSILRSFAAVSM